jgi:hypothetical protein
MTAPAPLTFALHDRLTVIGTIGVATAPYEAFAFTVNLGSEGSYARPANPMADLAADVQTFFSSVGAKIGTNAQLRSIKLASIGVDGSYTNDPLVFDYPSAVIGGGGGFTYPPQVSWAVSLVTARRGPSGKGRFFLPCPNVGVANTGLVDDVGRDACQAAAATFLTALGNWPGLDPGAYGPIVASSKGFNTKVTGVRVGRALDTIRSRRRSLNETYDDPTPVSA